mmetsp:Transcript_41015/g.86185  ORF Transcript_41015/g.86185 Transcript_41015/m.86185 type:complete len:107 (-) Transcript_41015:80-400(-)
MEIGFNYLSFGGLLRDCGKGMNMTWIGLALSPVTNDFRAQSRVYHLLCTLSTTAPLSLSGVLSSSQFCTSNMSSTIDGPKKCQCNQKQAYVSFTVSTGDCGNKLVF